MAARDRRRTVFGYTNDHYSGALTFPQNQAEKEYNFGLYDITGTAKLARNTWAG